jgi:hypothetical protein
MDNHGQARKHIISLQKKKKTYYINPTRDMIRFQFLYNFYIFLTIFLKLTIKYVRPTYRKLDLMISLKKKNY